jgi:MFS family permease
VTVARGSAAPPGRSVDDGRRVAAGQGRPDWRRLLAIYGIASVAEGIGVSQVLAFLPLSLGRMGVAQADIGPLVGYLSALPFILGLPLVPFWAVWADRYSRKLIIVRSSAIEAIVFALVAGSREPWHLAVAILCMGLQLGNTGVMLAVIRDVAPPRRLGAAVSILGALWPVGSAVGPALGGAMVDWLDLPLSAMFAVASGLALLSTFLLVVATPEVRPEVVRTDPVPRLVRDAIAGVLQHPGTRRLFALYGLSYFGRQIALPFLPLRVQDLVGAGPGLASAVGFVTGTAALAGALVVPLAGALGDRIGFRPVLVAGFLGAGIALALMPLAGSVELLGLIVMVFAAFSGAAGSMVFALLALGSPSEQRSATLNLVSVPLYIAGTVGPSVGAAIVGSSLAAVFVAGGLVYTGTGAVEALAHRARPALAVRSRGR